MVHRLKGGREGTCTENRLLWHAVCQKVNLEIVDQAGKGLRGKAWRKTLPQTGAYLMGRPFLFHRQKNGAFSMDRVSAR